MAATGTRTCYRHPDRETGVSCSNCGRPICPDCMTPTSVGMRCPECAAQKTKVRTVRNLGSDPQVTYALLIAIVLAFVGSGQFGMGGGGGTALFARGDLRGPLVADGEVWRLVTSGFLHAGPLHLAFNMIALWVLGRDLELVLGRLRYGLLYGVSLLGGSTAVTLLGEPDRPVLGASGAVFGLMGALVIVLRRLRLSPGPALTTIVINVVLTFTIPGLSVLGHLGGLVTGLAVAAALVHGPARSRPRAGLLAVGGIAALLVVLVAVRAVVLGA